MIEFEEYISVLTVLSSKNPSFYTLCKTIEMSNLPPVEKRKTLEDLIAEDARSPIPTLVQPNTITGNLPPPQNLAGIPHSHLVTDG